MLIKGQNAECLEIKILRRENSKSTDYWDGNWLNAEVKIETSHFKAHYGTNFRAEDFQRFYDDIIRLKNHDVNEVVFTTMEEGLHLNLELQKNGSLLCSGKTNNLSENSLEFQFTIDNMALNYLVDQLREILKEYPVIGSPE